MLKPQTIEVIKSTLPILQQHGEELTRLFYARLFENNPEVTPFFNQAHQHAGSQQRALAAAICAYAEHIETPEKLSEAVELIAQKHASLGIQAEHYPIVGENLLAAIEILLADAATEEIINAWSEAYSELVDIFVHREQMIYNDHAEIFGWQGFKEFSVVKREANSGNITSFYLQPTDGSELKPHQAGQYITVRWPSTEQPSTLRNYSLSNGPSTEHYRISVKRELSSTSSIPNGVVSNLLHDTIKQGDILAIGPPCGEFTLKPLEKSDQEHIVFIAGGVGITPLLSMLHTVLEQTEETAVTLIQAAINGHTHAFEDEIKTLNEQHKNFHWHIRYSEPNEDDRNNQRFDSVGMLDERLLKTLAPTTDKTRFYLCGPEPMLKHCYQLLRNNNVSASQIHYEFFGPAGSLED